MQWYIVSLYLHVIFAIFWVGGMLYLPLVILPALKNEPNRRDILIKSGLKFRLYGWIAMIGLLMTGYGNIRLKGIDFSVEFLLYSRWGNLLLYKIVIFLFVSLITMIHDVYIGEKFRNANDGNNEVIIKIAKYSGRLSLILSLLAVLFGILLSRGITL